LTIFFCIFTLLKSPISRYLSNRRANLPSPPTPSSSESLDIAFYFLIQPEVSACPHCPTKSPVTKFVRLKNPPFATQPLRKPPFGAT
jgi:hypothetical protein